MNGPALNRKPVPWLWPTVISLFLVAGLAALFGPLTHAQFINCDDPDYVLLNGHVWNGLTWSNIRWAFELGPGHASNWHPLTWLSHMFDCQIFGLDAGRHHLVNLLFHAANTLLLFHLLRRLTGLLWPATWVAAFFALHPLRLESVAWVAERKDVLSAFFFLLTLFAYHRYTLSKKALNYLLTLFLFALALLAKPMAVTLPFILLLLDIWPLQRWQPFNPPSAIRHPPLLEKVPFFLLSAVNSWLTLQAQTRAMISLNTIPFPSRLANALISYVEYLRKMIWPNDLAIFYQHPVHRPWWHIAGAAGILVAITLLASWQCRRRPWLIIGWLWFLGMLVPTIGLVQVGSQSMADRYTYLPMIGILFAVIWTINDFLPRPLLKKIASAAALVLLLALCPVTAALVRCWLDPIALFEHALTVAPDGYFLEHNLANALANSGFHDQAVPHYQRALQFMPNDGPVLHHMGNNYVRQEKYDQAIACYQLSLASRPDDAETCFDYATVLSILQRYPAAEEYFERTLRLDPGHVEARVNYANTLLQQHKIVPAIALYQQALAIFPDMPEAHFYFSSALALSGRWSEAVSQMLLALHYRPNYPSAANDLAWILATSTVPGLKDPARAVRIAETSNAQTTFATPGFLDTLAVAYASAGRFPDAIRVTENIIKISRQDEQQRALIPLMETRLALYRENRPYQPAASDPVSIPKVTFDAKNH